MSPILVRPVREQIEHDRIVRLLHAKFRRKYEAGMNPGNEQTVAVSGGAAALYPDLVLHSLERGHRLQFVIEVETGESVNHLEALAEWANFARLRAAFHLYVPSGMVDVARRLCEGNQINVGEIWSYHTVGEDVRFALVHRLREASVPARRAGPAKVRSAAKAAPAAGARSKAKAPRPPASKVVSRAKPAKPPRGKPVARSARGLKRK